MCKSPVFQEAIFYASKSLFDSIIKYLKGEVASKTDLASLKLAVFKYFTRMATRATPFGLFSGIGVCEVGNGNSIKLDFKGFSKNIKLDAGYLYSAVYDILHDKKLRTKFYYSVNPSLFRLNDEYRYIEKVFDVNSKSLSYVYSSLNWSEYLEEIINNSQSTVSFTSLGENLVTKFDSLSTSAIEDFLFDLIDNNVLINEIEPTIIGDDYLEYLSRKLAEREVTCPNRIRTLEEHAKILRDLQTFSRPDINASFQSGDFFSQFDSSLFQVNSCFKFRPNVISDDIIADITKAIGVLIKFSNPSKSLFLSQFKDSFIRKYERQRVPLVELFDPDLGLNLPVNKINSPLTDDLFLAAQGNHNSDNELVKTVRDLLHKQIIYDDTPIDISDFGLDEQNFNHNVLPETFSVLAEIFEPNQNYKAHILSSGHSSAINFIGRFTCLNTEVLALAKEISSYEAHCLQPAIVADIAHIPISSRASNVLHRNFLWDYEINYHVTSNYTQEKQIKVLDIEVSVNENDEVILWFKNTDRRIYPRVSSTIDQSNSSALFKFLVDLECEGKCISFGVLPDEVMNFTPRIVFKNIILSPAIWAIVVDDISSFSTMDLDSQDFQIAFNTWLCKRRLPKKVLLADGDNELLLNFSCQYSIEILLKEVKKKGKVLLREFYFDEFGSILSDTNDNRYANQVVVSLYKK